LSSLLDFVLVLIVLSAGFLVISGIKAILKDMDARRRPANGLSRPDGLDLTIDVAMTLLGVAGLVGALWALGFI
jgi:hypothetical protein